MPFQTFNPYTERLVESFDSHSEAQVTEALTQAGRAFRDWKATSVGHRQALMHRCAAVLSERAEEYGRLITLEMGKTLKEAVAEVRKCAGACTYYAEHAEAFLRDRPVPTEAARSFITYEPLGAVLAIMPWNFPFWQVFRFACPALVAGNVGLLKHAPNVPQCALAIESTFREAGFPVGVFTNLFVETEGVPAIIAHPTVRAVTLTGSETAGSSVAAIAGRYLKKAVMELGGSDPFVVLADADLERATRMAAQTRMMNAGQSCISAKRFIVVADVAEAFVRGLQTHLSAMKGGDPFAPDTDYGPLARRDLADHLRDQVQRSVECGARIAYQGDCPTTGFFFPPTILTDVRPGMAAYEEELFGPVATVLVVKDADEAVTVANDTRYGLGASVWTRDTEAGERLARQLESGCAFINEIVKSDPRLPFGGVKQSGYGRELSEVGLHEFVNIRTVWAN